MRLRRVKASPFGRGGTEGDGEGKPPESEPLRSDRQALCRSDTIAVRELFGSVLALSGAPRQLPQRGSPWHVGQASTGRAKHDVSETVVLRCLGQRQLYKARLDKSCCKVQPLSPSSPEAPLVGEPLAKRESFAECQSLPY